MAVNVLVIKETMYEKIIQISNSASASGTDVSFGSSSMSGMQVAGIRYSIGSTSHEYVAIQSGSVINVVLSGNGYFPISNYGVCDGSANLNIVAGASGIPYTITINLIKPNQNYTGVVDNHG